MADIGRQQRVFHYRQPLESSQFNRIFSKTLPPGIYDGGTFTRVSGTSISISPLSVIIEDATADSDIAVRIRTMDPVVLAIAEDPTRPLIIVRYTWVEDSENYMEFIQVTETIGSEITNLHEKDLIIGKLVFSGTQIAATNSFDYTRANRAFANPSEDHLLPILVVRTPVGVGNEKKVYIESGNVLTNTGLVSIVGQYTASISDTTLLGRNDYVYLDELGVIRIQEGEASATPVTKPYYGRKVLAEIRRGPNRTDIKGGDIFGTRSAERAEIKSTTILVKDLGASEVFAKNADGLITVDMALRELWAKAVAIENRALALENGAVYKAGDQSITGAKTFNTMPRLASPEGTTLAVVLDTNPITKKHFDDNTVKLSGNQNVSGVKTFTSFPKVPIASSPTEDSEVISKKHFDDNVVKLTTDQTVAGVKTFSSFPKVPETDPIEGSEVISKTFLEGNAKVLRLGTSEANEAQTVYGVKTFISLPRIPTDDPTQASEVVSKQFLEGNAKVLRLGTSDVNEAQTVFGVKTFRALPKLNDGTNPLTPSATDHPITKKHFDDNTVKLTTDQTIAGVKTFSSSPKVPDVPADGNSVVNKNFIDGGSSNLVHKTGDETIGGAKTFTSQVNAPSFNASSSRKVKENIFDSEDKALDIIKKTKIVRYSYIDDPDSYSHIGFIAEDTPEILTGKDHNTMSLSDVCGVLLKAVQELTEEIKILKERR
jgi:hypothetical protein